MLEKLHVFHIRKSNSHIFVQLSAAHGRVGEAARETHAFGLEAALQRRHEPLLASSSVVSDSSPNLVLNIYRRLYGNSFTNALRNVDDDVRVSVSHAYENAC